MHPYWFRNYYCNECIRSPVSWVKRDVIYLHEAAVGYVVHFLAAANSQQMCETPFTNFRHLRTASLASIQSFTYLESK